MNKYQLYKLLRKHEDLKVKRHPMFDKNRFMKFLLIFMWLYYAAILIRYAGHTCESGKTLHTASHPQVIPYARISDTFRLQFG